MSVVSSEAELPLVLTMRHVKEIMNLSKLKAYELPHQKGFPAIRCGRAIRVPRDAFFRWLNEQAGVQEEL